MHPAFGCPGCGATCPGPGSQTCSRCGLRLAIFAGYASDPSVVPPHPAGNVHVIRVKAPAGFTVRYGVLEAYGVAEGELDPVIAASEMNKSGVAYPEIVSLTFWRKTDWVVAVLAGITFVPIGLALTGIAVVGIAVGAAGSVIVSLLFGVAFLGLGGFFVHRALVVKKQFARVVGLYRTIDVRFDRGARDTFRLELLRRAGLPPVDMP